MRVLTITKRIKHPYITLNNTIYIIDSKGIVYITHYPNTFPDNTINNKLNMLGGVAW